MAETPATQNLPTSGEWINGSRFDGLTITVLIDSAPPASAITAVDIDLELNNEKYYSFKSDGSGDSGITLDSANVFTVDAHNITLPANSYDYDVKLTFADGDINYYLKGKWVITAGVSD